MIKSKIQTETENNEMWSSAYEEDDNENDSEKNEDDKKSKRIHILNLEEAGGPYEVSLKKMYKPVFILFCDLLFAITFFSWTLIQFWRKNLNMKTTVTLLGVYDK